MQVFHKKFAAILLPLFISSSTFATSGVAPLEAPAGEQKPLITPEHARAIYKHLVQDHWVPDTGLFISFLGTQDHKLAQQASTYEQAAVGILAVRLGDIDRAKGIFHFLRTAWLEGPLKGDREGVSGLTNFYNAEFGGEGIEKTIHSGPNAWAGLFAAYYGNKTGDTEAITWAMNLAHWMTYDLPHQGGGVAMGPVDGSNGVPWTKIYSTENNVSYYAFLSELLRSNDIAEVDRTWLTEEKTHVEDWLVTTAFDRLAYTMNRGVNPDGVDRTRALDTITWLISAVGPERLAHRGIDPNRLMKQAEDAFVVKVQGHLGVDPADQPEADLTFASSPDDLGPHRGTPRSAEDQHRMIWYEGLGQYINALNTVADYFHQVGDMEKSLSYAEKARVFTEQYDLAALKNYPEGTAYMYATQGKFFHDGWYPPQDSPDGPPSSLIASVWRCFAGLGMDPLAGQDIAGVPPVDVTASQMAEVPHSRPSILFGSSEDMVVQAWQDLDQGNTDHAIQQAQATIQEWSPWALKLEEKKAHKIGRLVDYTGQAEERKDIFDFWALNDVAAAYYILGKVFDQQSHYAQAAGAFQQIAMNYPLAQVWDPRGWFWSPMESVRDDFVSLNPRHYGRILPQMLAATSAFGKEPN